MKPNVKLSHLVVNGCSFTYCQGLENPAEQGWPALLANKLKVPVVNLAIPGSGNDAIFRRTYEYFYLNKKYNNFPLFINVWSFSGRREEFFSEYKGSQVNDFVVLDFQGQNPIEKEVVYNLLTSKGMISAERKKLLYWAACIELFKNNKMPYLMSDTFPIEPNYLKELEEEFPDQVKQVYDDKNKVTNISTLAGKEPHLPCGHYGESANQVIAKYFYDLLIDRYNMYITRVDKFTDLNEYRTNTVGMHLQNAWRKK